MRSRNRSALEWVIDQYQVSEDKRSGIKSDPNREEDEQYIVRLVGQVVRVRGSDEYGILAEECPCGATATRGSGE